jgi:hypothetical protein
MCLLGVRLEFLIRSLEVLGMGPEPDPLSKFFCKFLNLHFLKTGIIVLNTMKNGVFTSF